MQDSSGKPVAPNYPDGSYTLTGLVTFTASENYPGLLAYAQSHNNKDYANAYSPTEFDNFQLGSPYNNATYQSNAANSYAYAGNAVNVNGLMGFVNGTAVNGSVKMSSAGTVTETWVWVPAAAPNGRPAPPYLDLLISAPVSVRITPSYSNSSLTSGMTGTATASNGLGDTVTATAAGLDQVTPGLPGKHLRRFAVGPGGKVTVSVSLSSSTSSSNSVPYSWGSAAVFTDAYASAKAWQDDREVTISCPAVDIDINGDSKYRDPAVTGPVVVNARQPDGTLRGDTVVPLGDGSFAYTPNVIGFWNAVGTTWHWYSSPVSNGDLSGDYPNVQVFNDVYLYGAAVGKTEHIYLSLYDGHDQAKAAGNYYMHYHYQFEPASRPLDQPPYKVMGPDPEAASFATPPPSYPWQLVLDRDGKALPPLIGPQGANAAINIGGSKTTGFHGDVGIGIAKEPFNVQFGIGADSSKSTDYSTSVNPTPAVGQYKQTWAIWRLSVNRSKGHVDIYSTHGYTGTAPWYTDNIVTTDYTYFRPYAPTGVTPYVPGPGWNPPGY